MKPKIPSGKTINLLIVTAFFPPIKSVASQRLLSFVKYLPSDRYSIKVLTIGKGIDFQSHFPNIHNVEVFFISNRQLLQLAGFDTPANYLVHKIKALYNKIILRAGVNPYGKWAKRVVKKAEYLHRGWPIDMVLASYPTHEALQAGMAVAKKFNLHFVADLRDGITNNDSNAISSKAAVRLEDEIAKNASLVISVSKPILEYFHVKHPEYKNPFAEIRNGFDFEPVEGYVPNKDFTVTYAGKFYGERRPDLFFKAIESLIKRSLIENIQIKLIGVPANYRVPAALESKVTALPYQPYEQTIKYLQKSDSLLLILGESKYKGIFSGKLFDYLGTYRSIIALCDPNDVAATLIRRCNTGFVASTNNQSEIETAVLRSYELWKQGRQLPINKETINAHHRREQAARLHNAILQLISDE